MTQKVTIELDAKDAAMVAAWQRARNSIQAMEGDLKKIEPVQQRNTKGLGDYVGKLVTVQSAISLVTREYAAWSAANRKILEETNAIVLKYDEIGRKFQIQAGLKGLEAESAKTNIAKIAVEQSFDPARAMEVATQMVSSGFSAKEASGGSLAEFLRILNAGSATGKEIDVKQLAEGMTGYLTSQGLEANAANVARIGRGTQRLMNPTNLQIPDLVELAKVGSVLAAGVTPEEQLAAMSVSKDLGRPGAEGANAFRSMIGSLTAARANKKKMTALKMFGLAPEDVDLVGEGFQDVIGRLGTGFEQIPAERRQEALKLLFGEEHRAFAFDVIQGRGKIGERLGMMQDDAGFLRDVATATSGPAAGARRLAAENELQKLARSAQDANVATAYENELRERGVSPWGVEKRVGWYKDLRGQNFSPETALRISSGWFERGEVAGTISRVAAAESAQGGSSLVYNGRTITDENEIAKIMQELVRAVKENTNATKQNNQATGENTKRQNGGRARDAQPPAPAAANQLDDRR